MNTGRIYLLSQNPASRHIIRWNDPSSVGVLFRCANPRIHHPGVNETLKDGHLSTLMLGLRSSLLDKNARTLLILTECNVPAKQIVLTHRDRQEFVCKWDYVSVS